jgi:hypothetical protein
MHRIDRAPTLEVPIEDRIRYARYAQDLSSDRLPPPYARIAHVERGRDSAGCRCRVIAVECRRSVGEESALEHVRARMQVRSIHIVLASEIVPVCGIQQGYRGESGKQHCRVEARLVTPC